MTPDVLRVRSHCACVDFTFFLFFLMKSRSGCFQKTLSSFLFLCPLSRINTFLLASDDLLSLTFQLFIILLRVTRFILMRRWYLPLAVFIRVIILSRVSLTKESRFIHLTPFGCSKDTWNHPVLVEDGETKSQCWFPFVQIIYFQVEYLVMDLFTLPYTWCNVTRSRFSFPDENIQHCIIIIQ